MKKQSVPENSRVSNLIKFFAAVRQWKQMRSPIVLLAALLFSPLSHADTIDLSKPIALSPERGAALFSFTLSSQLQGGTTLSWRAIRKAGEAPESGDVTLHTTGWIKNEELAKTPHHKQGALFGLDLPPGTYEFYQFRSAGGRNWVSAKEDFSRKFVVEAGKVSYVGNFDLLTGEGDFGGGRLLVAFLVGVFTNAFDTYPTLIDRADIDLPLFVAKGNGLTADTIANKVIVDAADRAMLAKADELRARADGGDVVAASTMMVGLARSWAVLPDQSRIKFFNGREGWRAYAGGLADQGVPGAATYLGLSDDALVGKVPMPAMIYHQDDSASALKYYLMDADLYQANALTGAKRLLEKGVGNGTDREIQIARLESRLKGLQVLTPESLPYGDGATRLALQQYLELPSPKYFSLSASGAHGMSSGDKPSMKAALDVCNATNRDPAAPCLPYANYSHRVWNACTPEMYSPKLMGAPPATGLGDAADLGKLPPQLSDAGRLAYADFVKLAYPRAFAVSEQGAYGLAAGDCQAAYRALLACEHAGKGNCRLWAIDEQIVRGAADAGLIAGEGRLLEVVGKDLGQPATVLTKEDVR